MTVTQQNPHDFHGNIGGFGVGEFTWRSEHGTKFQLVWSHGGPWLFGVQSPDGEWLHHHTNALPECNDGKQAFKAARSFVANAQVPS